MRTFSKTSSLVATASATVSIADVTGFFHYEGFHGCSLTIVANLEGCTENPQEIGRSPHVRLSVRRARRSMGAAHNRFALEYSGPAWRQWRDLRFPDPSSETPYA